MPHPFQSGKRKAPELLAPAGGPEAGYAALQYGADAIYLGLGAFSARAEAENFDAARLADIVGCAHALQPRRRVYVTVNTLVKQRELQPLLDTLALLEETGVDAVIVQDLGVVRLARRHFPGLRLHASTQLAIHNRAGVEAARDMGFARVTLARELTLDEVRSSGSVPDVEVETFLHGALCYGYSGLCLFSSLFMGRSGNRGRCAYLCRDRFAAAEPESGRAAGGGGFIFSMKDLALPEQLDALRAAGVAAVKIEGRMKSALYVAATVNYYRRLLDGGLSADEAQALAEDIRTVFSRPWTTLYVGGRQTAGVVDAATVGHRGTPIGTVDAVIREGDGHRLRFRPRRALEAHDGLQVEAPGWAHPFGFAVDRLRILDAPMAGRARGGFVFEAPAGARVEVALPPEHPEIPVGAPLFCASSQAVKRRYRVEVPKAGLHRARIPVRFRVGVGATEVRVVVTVVGINCEDRSGCSFRGACSPPSFSLKPGLTQGQAPLESLHEDDYGCRVDVPGGPSLEAQALVSGAFDVARQTAEMGATVRAAFDKLGNTPYAMAGLELENPDNRFVPVSVLNQVRRAAVLALTDRRDQARRSRLAGILQAEALGRNAGGGGVSVAVGAGLAAALPARGAYGPPAETLPHGEPFADQDAVRARLGTARAPAPAWLVKTDDLRHVARFEAEDWDGVEELIVELGALAGDTPEREVELLADRIGRERIRLALPLLARSWEWENLGRRVRRLGAAGWRRWEAGNLYGRTLLRALGPAETLDWTADWSLYALNGAAIAQWLEQDARRVTLSPEDGLDNLQALLSEWGGASVVIVYQDTPLMISEACVQSIRRSCPRGADTGAAACDPVGREDVRSSFGETIRIASRDCRSVVLGARPLCWAGRLADLRAAGARRFRADFAWRAYEPDEVLGIWRQVRAGRAVPGSHVGNFDRGLA